MRKISPVLLGLVGLLISCDQKPKVDLPELGEAFPNLPIPARSEVVSRQGSVDALQITLRSALPATDVADFYRSSLSAPGWRLVSDTRDSAGAYLLYAEGRRPLWVRISSETKGTLVSLNGAVPGLDTSYTRRREASADTINTLRPR